MILIIITSELILFYLGWLIMENDSDYYKRIQKQLSIGLKLLGISVISTIATATIATFLFPPLILALIPTAIPCFVIGSTLAISSGTDIYEHNMADKESAKSERTSIELPTKESEKGGDLKAEQTELQKRLRERRKQNNSILSPTQDVIKQKQTTSSKDLVL